MTSYFREPLDHLTIMFSGMTITFKQTSYSCWPISCVIRMSDAPAQYRSRLRPITHIWSHSARVIIWSIKITIRVRGRYSLAPLLMPKSVTSRIWPKLFKSTTTQCAPCILHEHLNDTYSLIFGDSPMTFCQTIQWFSFSQSKEKYNNLSL